MELSEDSGETVLIIDENYVLEYSFSTGHHLHEEQKEKKIRKIRRESGIQGKAFFMD